MNPALRRPRHIIHVDMDAFFAAVEQRDDPRLRGKPVIVGGPEHRGVVATASYEARPYGVGSAMPMAEALHRCPQAIVVSGRHGRYAEVSRQVFDIFHRYTPLVEGLSLDEAFLDVSASLALFGNAPIIAQKIRETIQNELQLTASAGVAPNKFVAKIASEMEKPNGLTVATEPLEDFLAPLAIERMWGVGPVAAKKLRQHGLCTFADIARRRVEELVALFGEWGAHISRLSCGIDDRPVESVRETKSVSAEETFATDLTQRNDIRAHLLKQAERVAERLHRKGMKGRCIGLKIKYADFSTKTRSQTLPDPVGDTKSIYNTVCILLGRLPQNRHGIRLTGVSVSLFDNQQTQLFTSAALKRADDLENVKANIRNKYGIQSVLPATLLKVGKIL